MEHDAKLVELVGRHNRAGGAYHRIDLGDGLVLEGEYDMAAYLDHYGLPEDLRGLSVLDVGTSTGFFALECARRGADVTAIDVWDQGPLSGLAAGLGLEVRYLRMDVYDLTPPLGDFDLVVCGSVLLHLWNPFAALRAIVSVCRDRAIVATAILRTRFWQRRRPLAELVAARGQGGDTEYWTTWHLSAAAVGELMRAAGFARVEQRADFELESAPGRQGFRVRHGVFHGFV